MSETEDRTTESIQSRTQRDERLGEKMYQQWALEQLQMDYHMCNPGQRKIIWRGGVSGRKIEKIMAEFLPNLIKIITPNPRNSTNPKHRKHEQCKKQS